MGIFSTADLGLDLGTSSLRIVMRNRGIVHTAPAYVAYERGSRSPLFFGEQARSLYGKAPSNIVVERPFRTSWVSHYDLVTILLRTTLRELTGRRGARPRVIMALPGSMTDGERQSMIEIVLDAGVRDLTPVDETVAGAIGAGLDVGQQYGRMNVDIGGARTNVSVHALGHQVLWDVFPIAGDRFDDAIIDYMRRRHNLLIGERSAERLKLDIGGVRMKDVSVRAEVYGRSLVSGLPRSQSVSSEELSGALEEPLRDLVIALRRTLERTPPELASDIFDAGICLSGGGAALYGLDRMIEEQLGIKTILADEPDLAVAHGLESLLNAPERYENIDLYTERSWRRAQ